MKRDQRFQRSKGGNSKRRSRMDSPYESDESPSLLLSDNSIAVYRSVSDDGLAAAVEGFRKLTDDLVAVPRGLAGQEEIAVNLLQTAEIRYHKDLLGKIAVNDATNSIYASVPSIRHKRVIKPVSVRLMGYQKSPMRPIGIVFDEESSRAMLEERNGIQSALEDLTNHDHEEFSWIESSIPHISLGKVDMSHGIGVVREVIDNINEMLPDEVVLLRATIHT